MTFSARLRSPRRSVIAIGSTRNDKRETRQYGTRIRQGIAAALVGATLIAVPAATTAPASAAPAPVKFGNWTQQGDLDAGTWTVAPDGLSVVQSVNDSPTFFISDQVVVDASLTGSITVETTGDDDIIGMTVGYNGPLDGRTDQLDHIVFDWKQSDQNGFGGCTSPAGMSLMRIKGVPLAEAQTSKFILDNYWCKEQVVNDPRVEVLASDWGSDKGWKDNVKYDISIDYSPNRIVIRIDGVTIFDVAGSFDPGRFGFYNYSQNAVRYEGFLFDPTTSRLEGPDRFETSIAISKDLYDDGEAGAVVLARGLEFADSLAGTPLAADKRGPLLITPETRLLGSVADEIVRVLGNDRSKTVYLLGGAAALSPEVESAVRALGYRIRRLGGADRFETAVIISTELTTVNRLFIADGLDFGAALVAGPAAAENNGAVLLTAGSNPRSSTTLVLSQTTVPATTVGAQAANAYPDLSTVGDGDRIRTSIAVAERFFTDPVVIGLSRADNFADSLGGGAHVATGIAALGRAGGPILLTPTGNLDAGVSSYLCAEAASLKTVFIYGGVVAISNATAIAAAERAEAVGCP